MAKQGKDPEESLLRRIMDEGHNKSEAIAIAKSRGLIKQSGDGLVLTDKGRRAKQSSDGSKKKKSKRSR